MLGESWSVIDVGFDAATLLLNGWVSFLGTRPGSSCVMVVVRPLNEVVAELVAGDVGSRVFKINDNELLVLVCWLKKR